MTIYEAITNIMQEGYSISKDRKNPQQGYKYRGIDDVLNVFQPLLSKYKVFVVPEVIDHQREERQGRNGGNLIYSILTIRYTFYADDGSSVSAVVVGEGMDSGDKASNKALSVGMKYAMFQTFCIPTEELIDSETESPEPLPKKEPPKKVEPPKEIAKSYTCADCHKTIEDYKGSDGKVRLTSAEIATRSMDAYGRQLCMPCSKLARMAEATKESA